jgi:hypothetical protein
VLGRPVAGTRSRSALSFVGRGVLGDGGSVVVGDPGVDSFAVVAFAVVDSFAVVSFIVPSSCHDGGLTVVVPKSV